jgi:ribosomal protein S18 acetylase RimI-like enzyme
MELLNLPPNQISQITPTGLSTDGSVIAGYDDAFATTIPVAYLWTLANNSFDVLPDAFQINGISGDGSIAVGHLPHPNPPFFSPNVPDQPMRWSQLNGIENLTKGGSTAEMSATAISSDGSTIVGYAGSYSPGYYLGDSTQACYWPSVFDIHYLDPLPGGTHARANAVSADGGVIVGYALLLSFWSNEVGGEICILDELYVDPGHRSRGHVTGLVEALMRGDGPWPGGAALELEVSPDNSRARALYEKLGFRNIKNTMMRIRRH